MSDMTIAREAGGARSPRDALIAVGALLTVSTLVLAALLPSALVLPALSVLFVAVGFITAAGLYLAGYRDRTGAWEFAALVVFFGFAAAMLTNNGEALALIDQVRSGTLTASSN